MGFHEVARVLEASKTTGYERLAIVALAHRVKDERGDGAAWPGVDTFAADVNCSERFIQKIVKGWRLAPHEVYVIDGGGRYNPNKYIILAGCSFTEVVRRLMVNLNITEQQAEKVAGECGYQKGEHYDIPAAATTGKGEHYDTERVNIGTQKGEHYAETVNTGSPEQEVNINLEPQGVELQPFSSSPTPPAAAVEEEKEISKSGPVEVLMNAFADLCKWRATNPKLAGYLDQIRTADPEVAPRDFRAFTMYYEAVRDKRDKYEHPYPLFVADGWGRFTEWWKSHREDGVFGYLPGVEDSINLPRWAWASFEDWPVGEGVLSPRWSGVVFYAKQEDGTFAEVPREQWPEWARESA